MPSGVSNRLTMSSTTRMGSPGDTAALARLDGVDITAIIRSPPPLALPRLREEFAATVPGPGRIAYRPRPRQKGRRPNCRELFLVQSGHWAASAPAPVLPGP